MARRDDEDWMGQLAAQDQYDNTERDFQHGIRQTPWFSEFVQRFGEEPDLNTKDYDTRGAWAAGIRPTVRDPGDGLLHWDSRWKSDTHPNRFIDGVDTKTGLPMGALADQNYDVNERAAQRVRQAVRPDAGRQEAPGQILGPLVEHLVKQPLRKGQGWLQSGLDYSANEFPETMGAIAQTTDYDPRRAAADYAAGAGFNTMLGGFGMAPEGVLGMAGGKLRGGPLTEKQFYDQYSQHLDLRGRGGTADANRAAILEHGFKQGGNVNTLPPYRGGEPRNIVDMKLAPRAGDTVYLVPNTFTREMGNGRVINPGWKPQPHEILKIEKDYPALYQEYLKAYGILKK